MDELAVKACLSGVYDPVRLACGPRALPSTPRLLSGKKQIPQSR
jgi:hypothetical protein